MSWFSNLLGGGGSPASADARAAEQAAAERMRAWEQGLTRGPLPDFVLTRLSEAAAGKRPWMSTMTPAELLLAKTHGLKPIATVTGTCWYQFDRSWTDGQVEGWRIAAQRIAEEAVACGANAVVDVKLRTTRNENAGNMDFTLIGAAVKLKRLPPSRDPVIATVSAMEFVRLLEMNIVPVGLAMGARHDWFTDTTNSVNGGFGGGAFGAGWSNRPLTSLSAFWERLRRGAHYDLRRDAQRQGNGVLAHTQIGQLIKLEGDDKQPPRYMGRHIVIGTVVDTPVGARVPHDITLVVDMRDDLSPLNNARPHGHTAYGVNEEEGSI